MKYISSAALIVLTACAQHKPDLSALPDLAAPSKAVSTAPDITKIAFPTTGGTAPTVIPVPPTSLSDKLPLTYPPVYPPMSPVTASPNSYFSWGIPRKK